MSVRFVLAPQAALDLVEVWRYIKEQTSVCWPVRLIRIGQVSIRVTVVMAKPGHGEGQAILIAAFGDEVEIAAR